MKWIYHNPVFDSEDYDAHIRINSAWSGHVKFGYDLVRFMKPKQIVELGTHYGTSFFSFCQAVKDERCSTKCFAVDTWKGDPHSGFYEEAVFQTVKTVIEKNYPNIGKMICKTFDDALNIFEDNTIDILHIDGYHTYEAVSHDFETWLPKISKNGIVLLHDITVKYNDFGVYKLWDILKSQYPSFQFEHSNGLGILFPKGYNSKFSEVFQKEEDLKNHYKN
ncbi:hypothetical protein COM81_18935 [Priestia megaterium]|uniref:class I SAM-dependent methyltransferase n=1 Tax=Priestia megaterium TaxID=1404 RepID=UPI000BEDE2BB|nr:class I SAM-dependent methyltransferase [Priestia megaterium]PEE75278.1 hypothetical protein COM81_18935 [Priestia megaterium]